ncbi:MAG: carbamoyltransferase HypF [Anaerolineales bacterium]
MSEPTGLRVRVKGTVQGVGFRPFVYRLAQRLALRGWVRNTEGGVDIEVDGDKLALQQLIHALRWEAPALATIDDIEIVNRSPNGAISFEIRPSQSEAVGFQPVSPDLAICPDCLAELFDPNDRHYRYPFVNCTNCGPRFTIIRDLPYDRPLTTMAGFAMCPACAAEYRDPANRRYHAQPVSCPECGPRIWLAWGQQIVEDREESLSIIRRLTAAGEIVAIKGLGGFHLACDATNSTAVATLRQRKDRRDKPLAIMMPGIAAVLRYCEISEKEREELESPRRPILLLKRKQVSAIAAEVAPGQNHLGVMLPYTPLHYLLLERAEGIPDAWVMTSGNRREEPILTENLEAQEQLGTIASAFLLHDRPIQARIDDSVVRIESRTSHLAPIRRSRGYAPSPIRLPWPVLPILATGPELKNTFCLARENYAFLSQHIGDLSNFETLDAYEKAIAYQEHLFHIKPQVIAYDLHPDYLSTRYALARAEREGIPAIPVQHHQAHIAACMAENAVPAEDRVIGVAFDGIGYGTDGAIWGGEVLVTGYKDFQRAYHLDYVPMPGGDLAVKQPWRMALAWLNKVRVSNDEFLGMEPDKLQAIRQQLATGVNAPLTSSIGRLFDAVAALVGLRGEVSYEGQAAIDLENCVSVDERGAYAFEIGQDVFSAGPVVAAVLADLKAGLSLGRIAARFHNGLADLVVQLAEAIRQSHAIDVVALSGGVWQNMTLLAAASARLEAAGFKVLTHCQVPANDGGISLGQLAVAYHSLSE